MSDNSNGWLEVPSEVLKAAHLNFTDVMNPVEAGFKIGQAIAGMTHDTAQKHLPAYDLSPSTGAGGNDSTPTTHAKSKTPVPGDAKGFDEQREKAAKAAAESVHPPVRQASPAHHH
jgi:hypothetical protein